MRTTQQLSRSKSAGKPGSHSSSLLAGRAVQAKLSVNEPGDDYEREADAMADYVMRSGAPPTGRTGFFSPPISAVQRKCQNCEEDDKEIQRKENSSRASDVMGGVTSYSGSLSSKGPKLPNSSRNFFETSFARDFFGARNHHDTGAAKSAQANASAHIVGNDVVINENQFSAESEKEKKLQRKENSSQSAEASNDVSSYVSSLSSKGSPLSESTKSFFEPRFGRDFSDVRIHNDSEAAKSSQSINALAYTTGNNIVFDQDQFSPESEGGKRLLAHELTHVVQQDNNNTKIQKACGYKQIKGIRGCIGLGSDLEEYAYSSEDTYKFKIGCDEFLPGEENRFRKIVNDTIQGNQQVIVDVHGFASEEGSEQFNEDLSCARAQKAASIIDENDSSIFEIRKIYMHGAKKGDREELRSFVLDYVFSNQPKPDKTTNDKPFLPPCCVFKQSLKYEEAMAQAWALSGGIGFLDKGDGRTTQPDRMQTISALQSAGYSQTEAFDLYNSSPNYMNVNIEDAAGEAMRIHEDVEHDKEQLNHCDPNLGCPPPPLPPLTESEQKARDAEIQVEMDEDERSGRGSVIHLTLPG